MRFVLILHNRCLQIKARFIITCCRILSTIHNMARPSVDSPSMAELVRNRRKSTPPSAAAQPPMSKEEGLPRPSSQPTATTTDHSDEIATLRREFAQQNQQLARTNSMISLKLAQVEAQLADFVRGSSAPAPPTDTQLLLDSCLERLESGVLRKFEEMLSMFADVRQTQGLRRSHRLKAAISILLGKTPRSKLDEIEEAPMLDVAHQQALALEAAGVSDRSDTTSTPAGATVPGTSEAAGPGMPETTEPGTETASEHVGPQTSKSAESDASGEFPATQTAKTSKPQAPKLAARKRDFEIFQEAAVERPTRNRKVVDYKPVSLHKKLRRQTDWLVTAVGDEPVSAPHSRRSSSSKPISHDEQRKPLSEVTNKPHQTKHEKPLAETSTRNEPSIFDFEDVKPRTRRTYGRRALKGDQRRFSQV